MYFLVNHKYNQTQTHKHTLGHTHLEMTFLMPIICNKASKNWCVTDLKFNILTSTIFLDWWVKQMSLIRVYFRIESRFYNKCSTTIVAVAIVNSRCILFIMWLHYTWNIEYQEQQKIRRANTPFFTLLFY